MRQSAYRHNMNSYYQLLKTSTADNITVSHFQPTMHAQGAWNDNEQHMAPATGIIAAELVRFMPREDMVWARISLDILGLIPLAPFSITTRIIRGGRTIELIESQLQSADKTAIIARAWRMQRLDSSSIGAQEDCDTLPKPQDCPEWHGIKSWQGGFIKTIQARSVDEPRLGRTVAWLNNDLDMIEGEPTCDLVHLLGMVDTANGVASRQHLPVDWAFPNLDLQIHFYRMPVGRWLGLAAQQQYGSNGVGLTSAILHDEQGAFGRSEQILTLRPL